MLEWGLDVGGTGVCLEYVCMYPCVPMCPHPMGMFVLFKGALPCPWACCLCVIMVTGMCTLCARGRVTVCTCGVCLSTCVCGYSRTDISWVPSVLFSKGQGYSKAQPRLFP